MLNSLPRADAPYPLPAPPLAAATHPVGILGLAPSNKDAYVERIEGATIASLVTASGPTPFNIQLGDKVRLSRTVTPASRPSLTPPSPSRPQTGTLQFGTTFKPKVICPLTVHKGDSWDIVGQINGHPMDWGTLDLQEHNLYIPAAVRRHEPRSPPMPSDSPFSPSSRTQRRCSNQ